MKFRILTTVTFVIALVAPLTPATPASAASSGEFVSDINSLRASKGLPTLTINGGLSSFAQTWAEKMAAAGSISHNPSLGNAPGNWSTVGENVGVGGSENSIFNALVASSGHYANMVNAKYNAIGVGVAVGNDGRIYTTHDFAAYPSSSAKTTPTTTTKPKPTTTSAPKQPATTATPPTNANSHASATTITPAAPSNVAITTQQTPPPAPELPAPSERIIQGLVEVGGISTQG